MLSKILVEKYEGSCGTMTSKLKTQQCFWISVNIGYGLHIVDNIQQLVNTRKGTIKQMQGIVRICGMRHLINTKKNYTQNSAYKFENWWGEWAPNYFAKLDDSIPIAKQLSLTTETRLVTFVRTSRVFTIIILVTSVPSRGNLPLVLFSGELRLTWSVSFYFFEVVSMLVVRVFCFQRFAIVLHI